MAKFKVGDIIKYDCPTGYLYEIVTKLYEDSIEVRIIDTFPEDSDSVGEKTLLSITEPEDSWTLANDWKIKKEIEDWIKDEI